MTNPTDNAPEYRITQAQRERCIWLIDSYVRNVPEKENALSELVSLPEIEAPKPSNKEMLRITEFRTGHTYVTIKNGFVWFCIFGEGTRATMNGTSGPIDYSGELEYWRELVDTLPAPKPSQGMVEALIAGLKAYFSEEFGKPFSETAIYHRSFDLESIESLGMRLSAILPNVSATSFEEVGTLTEKQWDNLLPSSPIAQDGERKD